MNLRNGSLTPGNPRLRSDGGPQFRSDFKAYLEAENITHELSSAYHHESNGHAEAGVRDMKHLLEKTKTWSEFRKALREYRNTPRHDGLSPAQWLFGRRQRTEAPALPQAYRRLSNEEIKSFEERREGEVEARYSKKGPRNLPQLCVGQLVVVQNPKTGRWESRGVIEKARSRRSYLVNINGRQFLRNRRFLRPCLNQSLPHLDFEVPEVTPIIAKSNQNNETNVSEKTSEDTPDSAIREVRRSHRERRNNVRFADYELY